MLKRLPPLPAKPPLIEIAEDAERETKDLLREVVSSVSYGDFGDVPLERFHTAKRLAIFDIWAEASDDEKAEQSSLPAEDLPGVRASALYARIKAALEEAFRGASQPRTAEEWVKAMEDRAFRRLAHIARYAVDPRIASAAARDFADRALPKVSRNNDEVQAPVLMITPAGAELIATALATVRRKALEDHRPSPLELPPPPE